MKTLKTIEEIQQAGACFRPWAIAQGYESSCADARAADGGTLWSHSWRGCRDCNPCGHNNNCPVDYDGEEFFLVNPACHGEEEA